jgi:hypothetical protein
VKKILTFLLAATLLAVLACSCGPGNKTVIGQIDRYELDDCGAEWAVVSTDQPPYSISFCMPEINSQTAPPGTWLELTLDKDGAVFDVHEMLEEEFE